MTMDHLRELQALLACVPRAPIHEAIKLIRATHDRGGTVWICGNGGSWATAAHFACDLRTAGIRAIALGQNGAVLTQIVNDADPKTSPCGVLCGMFADELHRLVKAGDVIVAISVSGTSGSVLGVLMETCERCQSVTMFGCSIEGWGRINIVCPGPDYETTEDAHLAVCHMIAKELKSET